MSRQAKLAALRAKTDRQLVTLVRSRLDEGLASRAEAEKAYSEVVVLLPTIHDMTETERRPLESKLARLRGLLDQRPLHAVANMQAACS